MRVGQLTLLALGAFSSTPVEATMPPGVVQEFYVPLTEDKLFNDVFKQIRGDKYGAFPPVHNTISFAISATDTIVYYDHSEDGFDPDPTGPNKQPSTQVWGDGDASNGCKPGVSNCKDSDDKFKSGESIILQSAVKIPYKDNSGVLYDGGDLIMATQPIAVTRAAYPEKPGGLMAGAVEVIEAKNWGSSFQAPIGYDVSTATGAYELSVLAVMAEEDDTKIYVNGQYKTTLARGKEEMFSVKQGDKITTGDDKKVQVDLIAGDTDSYFELRWYSLAPTDQWSKVSYASVGDTKGEVKITIFNPHSTPIEVDFETLAGIVPITVQPGTHAVSDIIPDGTGAKLSSDKNFFAFSSTDTSVKNSEGQQTKGEWYDWGYPLMTEEMITAEVLIGLGFGCTANNCGTYGNTNERSVVWVTPVEDAVIHVDFDNDGTADKTINAKRLQSIELTDTKQNDKDMSGASIWATKPGDNKAGVKMAAAWGQKASYSNTNDQYAMDLGTAVVPFEPFRADCVVTLKTDNDNSGDKEITVGDEVVMTITVTNAGQIPIDSDDYKLDTIAGLVDLTDLASRGGTHVITKTFIAETSFKEGTCETTTTPRTPPPTPGPTKPPTTVPPSPSPTPGPTEAPTPKPTASPTPTPTAKPTPSPTPSPTATPTAKPSPGPTKTPTANPTPEPTPKPSPGPTKTPTANPTPVPTPEPSPGPTKTPTAYPTPVPTLKPSPGPTKTPTANPTPVPTPKPSPGPTPEPSPGPTKTPTASPTPGPTKKPSPGPTQTPTASPTPGPTKKPSPGPTKTPTANPTPEPTPKPSPGPTTPSPTKAPANTSGDPHFTMFNGHHFDFHGECDLVFLDNPGYNNGQGMKIHIRTKHVRWWSYVKTAAVQIGDDILEVSSGELVEQGRVTNYWVNGKQGKPLIDSHVLPFTIGGHKVRFRVPKAHQWQFKIFLENGQSIILRAVKELMRVDLWNHHAQSFGSSRGILGNYKDNRMLGRDGVTVLDDNNAFGQEWQVRDDEPMLFHNAEGPQYPNKCFIPAPAMTERRRLGEHAISKEQAEAACKHVGPDSFKDCVFDVMATQDFEMADIY